MKAAIFAGPGQPLKVVEQPMPEIDDQQMLVRVSYCGICGTDIHVTREGPFMVPPNTVLGHEFSGRIAALGAAVEDGHFAVGDRVVSLPYIGKQLIGFGENPGGYGEYIRVGYDLVLKIPDAISDRDAALVEPFSVGLHAVEKAGSVGQKNVLIIGAGPIGLACAIWCRLRGARQVLISERVPARAAMAVAMGFQTLNADGDVGADFTATAGACVDIQFECVGAPGMLQACIERASTGGLIIGVGVCDQPDQIEPLGAVLKELCIQWVLAYQLSDFAKTLDAMLAGELEHAALITDVVTLEQLPAAFEALREPIDQCKVLVDLRGD